MFSHLRWPLLVLVGLAAAAVAPAARAQITFVTFEFDKLHSYHHPPRHADGPVFWPACEGDYLEYVVTATATGNIGVGTLNHNTLFLDQLEVVAQDGATHPTLWSDPAHVPLNWRRFNPDPSASASASGAPAVCSGSPLACSRAYTVRVYAGEDADHRNGVVKIRHTIKRDSDDDSPAWSADLWVRTVDRAWAGGSPPPGVCRSGSIPPPVGGKEPDIDVVVETWNAWGPRPTLAGNGCGCCGSWRPIRPRPSSAR